MEKLAQIQWGRGKFSEVFRSSIIDPSPIKPGQKVKVIWGETRKEYAAVIKCYPVEQHDSEPLEVETELPQRRARAKRKLVSKGYLLMMDLSSISFISQSSVNVVRDFYWKTSLFLT